MFVLGRFGQRADADTGIGNDDIGSAVLAGEIGGCSTQACRVADITGISCAGAGTGCGKTLEFMRAARDQTQGGAVCRVVACDGGAQSAGSAGNNDSSVGCRSHCGHAFSGWPGSGK